jgi:prolipoprotein diacylglyceryltransferase
MLYESAVYFCTLGVLLFILHKNWQRGRAGLMLGAFFVLVFGSRFFIEFLKEYQVASEAQLPLDLGQLLSIPFVLLGVFLIARALRLKSKTSTAHSAASSRGPARR